MKFISRKIRKNVTTSIFHIMVQGINKEYIFNQEIYIKKYLKFLKENQKQTNLKIIAYCIMTNHAHLLIKSENIQELSKFMQKVNSSYARYYNYMEKRVGYVFRDRFKSQAIMSEKQYYNCIRYIHLNPVKAKIVEKQEDYKYSSYIIYQKRLKKKEKLLNKSDIRVEIETNGAVDIAPLANAFSKEKLSLTMDYKLPSSGCEEKMLLSNMEALRKQDTVKFVSGSINDLECAEKIIEKFHLTERCQVFISSVFGSIEPVEIVNFMTSKRMNDVRLQIQMHKVIWNPEERGV